MRVFLPATAPLLASWLEARAVPGGRTGFAVTAGLRSRYDVGSEDELEDAARALAAAGSLRLLDLDDAAPRRRVVLAVEVPDTAVQARDDEEPGAVTVRGPVPVGAWAAGLVDGADAEADVAAAAEAVVAADLGSDDAAFTVAGAEGHELLWFATQELDAWVQLLP